MLISSGWGVSLPPMIPMGVAAARTGVSRATKDRMMIAVYLGKGDFYWGLKLGRENMLDCADTEKIYFVVG